MSGTTDDPGRLEALADIVAADPGDGLARFMLGRELLKAGRPAEAAEQLGEAVRLAPEHTASHRELGRALEAAGRAAEAASAWERGLSVAERTRDLQTAKEIRVFLARLRGRSA